MTTEQYQIGYEAGYSDGFDAGAKPAQNTITVPKSAWDAMRDALMAAEFHLVEMGQRGNGLHKQFEDALTAANAIVTDNLRCTYCGSSEIKLDS